MIKTFADNIEYSSGGSTPLEKLTIFLSNHKHCFIDIEGDYSDYSFTTFGTENNTYVFDVTVWQNGSAVDNMNIECSTETMANLILNYKNNILCNLRCFEIKRI